jgi:hypothetical protein
MSLPQLTSKQYKVEVFTPQFLLSATLEPVGALMPYLENADRNNLLFKQVSVTPIETTLNLPTFTAEELWVPRRELVALQFLEPGASETMRLMPNKEKLRVFLPHFVVQATFSHGPDTKLHEIFDVISGVWIHATEAHIYPLHPIRCQISHDAPMMLIIKHQIQFYQPVKE